MTPYRNDPRELTARFESKCHKCNETIHKGETIYYWPASKAAYHEACGREDYCKCVESMAYEDMGL